MAARVTFDQDRCKGCEPVSYTHLLYFAKATVNRQANFTAYAVAALFYLFFNYLMTKLFDYLERKYDF